MQDKQSLTPMMQQYFKIKEAHRDHLVFFRLGDFYEMFFEDAIIGSRELELTLTGRDCGMEERAPMCGVPHHSSEGYIAKLIKKGYKVAICEQVEDPAFAKGVVSREVIRVVTPGTLMEDNLLREDANNYLCCLFLDGGGCGFVFADISTGEMNLLELERDDDSAIQSELARFMPREVIFNSALLSRGEIAKYMRERLFCTADLLDDDRFEPDACLARIRTHFGGKDPVELGVSEKSRSMRAAGALLSYLEETQKTGLERMIGLNILEESRFMSLDLNTRANLELLVTARTGEKRGSLLWALDRTKTPMGKRLIKTWISQPLVNPAEIDKRLNAVEELYRSEVLLAGVRGDLSGIFDIERLITRIVYGSAGPREYKTLEQAVRQFPLLRDRLSEVRSRFLVSARAGIDPLEDVRMLLEAALDDEPAALLRDGGVIRKGYDTQLDELRSLMENARGILADMERDERENTGIKNLKIRYNRVFGYYLEVTNSYRELVPDTWIRKQTLAGSERFFTPELKELEERILTAHDRAITLEGELFEQMRRQVILQLHRIQRTAGALARLDVFASFACASLENRYVRPDVNVSDTISIQDGRHPVVELMLDGMPFVPNDALLDNGENQIAVVTGPNMAGKSTWMRQVALIVLMAQIGCFVPAASASIGVVDAIHTRIGAADDLSAGQSTFMVEMTELSRILQNATARSLIVLDEIGRGTSTYDGMSIARAVIEYLADPKKLGAKTLFATHYHELTEMEGDVPRVKNYNVAVKKRGEEITFLRRIVRGGADDSYGIEVSKLAGIPPWIIKRAYQVLEDLEAAQPVRLAKARPDKPAPDDLQISFLPGQDEVRRMVGALDLNTLTPIEALTTLYKIREKFES